MSSLQRYKKTGGFIQLVSLIETFGPQKKDKFLEMIDQESAVWGKALREKMLTLERIFHWPDQTLIEVFKSMPHKNQALALQSMKEDVKTRIFAFLSGAEKRRLDDVIAENPPKPEELASNMIKVIEITRKMLQSGELRAEKFDEGLVIPEEYEHKLDQLGANSYAGAKEEPSGESLTFDLHHAQHVAQAAAGTMPTPQTLDQAQLQRTLTALVKENKSLKEELKHLREKLEQIKKLSAA